MVGFDVTINGQRLCLAGVGDKGVLWATIIWAGGPGESREVRIGVSGRDDSSGMRLAWPLKDLELGDEVSIRIVETDQPDPKPIRYKRPSDSEAHDE